MKTTMKLSSLALLLGAASVGACNGSNATNRQDLRTAVDQAPMSLRQAVPVAVATTDHGNAINGSLVVGNEGAFDVGAVEQKGLRKIRVSARTGALLASGPSVPTNVAPCPTAIALDQALAVAETAAGGEAIAVVPDDDVACAREIQVLNGVTLWEVKVGGDGKVLEKELSDEFSGKEN